MDATRFVTQAQSKGGNLNSPPSDEILGPYADIIVQALNTLDIEQCTKVDWQRYVSYYDPEIIQLAGGALTNKQKKRLGVIGKFASKEREFLNTIDAEFVERSYQGDLGDTLRVSFVAEEKKYMQVRETTDRMVAAVFLSAFTSMATGTLDTTYLQVLERGETLLHDLQVSYDRHFNQTFDGIYEFTVDIEGERVTIQADRLQSIREKLRSLYRRKVLRLPPETS